MDKAIVEHRQTLIDVAIQYCGDASALMDIALLNGISPTKEVLPGQEILLPQVANAGMVKFLLDGGYTLATYSAKTLSGGIGSWVIGGGFIVS